MTGVGGRRRARGVIVVLFGLTACGGSNGYEQNPGPGPEPGPAPVCVTGEAAFPRPLALPNAEENGSYDPSLARDPTSGRLWMSYSGVTGVAGSGKVSTHLSYSDDDGLTWCHLGVVNQAEDVPTTELPPGVSAGKAHWSHEVSSLAHDPSAPANARWVLVWHRYLHVDDGVPGTDDRRFQYGWLAQRSAPSPEALLQAAETKLFSALAYYVDPETENFNDSVPGGLPEKRWDSDPDLGDCLVFTEPGLLASEGQLYMVFMCPRVGLTQNDIVLARRGTGGWQFVSTLLTTQDAQVIHPALEGFNASDLVAVGGGHRLLTSPMTNGLYQGCLAYGIDLSAGTLLDDDGGGPDILFSYPKNGGPEIAQTGVCTYDEDSPLGLIVGDTHVDGVQFRLIATGQSL